MLTEMTKSKSDHLGTSINDLRKEMIGRGLHLRIGRDFNVLLQHIEVTKNRAALHEQFDPNGDMDGAVDAFWLCGFDADGELIHTQAAHLLNLKSRSISDHISSTLPRYAPKSPALRQATIKAHPGPKARKVKGKVAYHGEMWLDPKYRDRATVSLANRLGLMLIMREWNPDGIFGLMNWKLAADGFNMRIGYTHSEPMTLTWDRADLAAEHQLWLVYLEREDAEFLFELPAVEYASALERNFA